MVVHFGWVHFFFSNCASPMGNWLTLPATIFTNWGVVSQTTYVTHFTIFTLVSEVTSTLQAVISDNESYLLRLECCFDGQPIQKTPRMDTSRYDSRRTSFRVSAIGVVVSRGYARIRRRLIWAGVWVLFKPASADCETNATLPYSFSETKAVSRSTIHACIALAKSQHLHRFSSHLDIQEPLDPCLWAPKPCLEE